MANQYILLYKDAAGNLRLIPERPTVQFQNTVIWVSNLDTDYVAQNFAPTSPQLFPDLSYTMQAGSQSTPAVVVFNNSGNLPIEYKYTCSDGSTSAVPGDSIGGIIIVDPTGPGEEKETKEIQRSSSKRSQEKAPVEQPELNGSRR